MLLATETLSNKHRSQLGRVMHICNSSTWEVEAGRLGELRVHISHIVRFKDRLGHTRFCLKTDTKLFNNNKSQCGAD